MYDSVVYAKIREELIKLHIIEPSFYRDLDLDILKAMIRYANFIKVNKNKKVVTK